MGTFQGRVPGIPRVWFPRKPGGSAQRGGHPATFNNQVSKVEARDPGKASSQARSEARPPPPRERTASGASAGLGRAQRWPARLPSLTSRRPRRRVRISELRNRGCGAGWGGAQRRRHGGAGSGAWAVSRGTWGVGWAWWALGGLWGRGQDPWVQPRVAGGTRAGLLAPGAGLCCPAPCPRQAGRWTGDLRTALSNRVPQGGGSDPAEAELLVWLPPTGQRHPSRAAGGTGTQGGRLGQYRAWWAQSGQRGRQGGPASKMSQGGGLCQGVGRPAVADSLGKQNVLQSNGKGAPRQVWLR